MVLRDETQGRETNLARSSVSSSSWLNSQRDVGDLNNFHLNKIDEGHEVEREGVVVGVGVVVRRTGKEASGGRVANAGQNVKKKSSLSGVKEDLSEASVLVFIISSIIPRIGLDRDVADLESLEFGLDIVASDGNPGSLVELETVDRSVAGPRKLEMMDDAHVGHIQSDLEEARRALDVIHPEEATSKFVNLQERGRQHMDRVFTPRPVEGEEQAAGQPSPPQGTRAGSSWEAPADRRP